MPELEPEPEPQPTDEGAALAAREQWESHVDGRVGGLEGSGDLADDLAVQDTRFSMMSSWLGQSARASAPPRSDGDVRSVDGSVSDDEEQEEEGEWDVFGEDTEEDLQRLAAVAAAAAERNAAAVAAAPPQGERTAAQARRLYMLDSAARRNVVTTAEVFSAEECAAYLTAVDDAISRRGGWETERHGA